jgi:hypothetical protein
VESVALNSHGDDTLDYEVRIRVLACEGLHGGSGTDSIRLCMSWGIQAVGTNALVNKSGGFTATPATWDGKDYGQMALRLSNAIAAAGATLAADVSMVALKDDRQDKRAPEKPSAGVNTP